MIRYRPIAALAVALAVAAPAAYAAGGQANDALAINKARIPLTQAVNAAEQHVGGKASRAEYEDTKQGWAYDVEVVSGKQVFDVKVDASTGAVLASTADQADQTDQTDQADQADHQDGFVDRQGGHVDHERGSDDQEGDNDTDTRD